MVSHTGLHPLHPGQEWPASHCPRAALSCSQSWSASTGLEWETKHRIIGSGPYHSCGRSGRCGCCFCISGLFRISLSFLALNFWLFPVLKYELATQAIFTYFICLRARVGRGSTSSKTNDIPIPIKISPITAWPRWWRRSVLPPHSVVGVSVLIPIRVEQRCYVPVNRLHCLGLTCTTGNIIFIMQ